MTAAAGSSDGSLVVDFNDLSQQQHASNADSRRDSPQEDEIPKPKRIACVLCRKRKLKCDSQRPACSTCKRLQHECSYNEVRKKSGPKRGYVKALEARLAQVETLLKTQDDERPAGLDRQDSDQLLSQPELSLGGSDYADILKGKDQRFMLADEFANMNTEDSFPWEMIGLGLDEPLPTQDVVDDLNREYFEKVHPSVPMIHKARYYAAMNLAPHMRPPVSLRYAMWAIAAGLSDKYQALQEHFYTRARKYLHQDEMRGHGESMITIACAQTWVLIATWEFKMMLFPRAWLSAGRASRMCMMMGLHRVDGHGLDVKQCLPPPKDFTEREERRRTFWMTFCVDRYSSIGTGWPMVIEEQDISTNLPCDEEDFEQNRTAKTLRLDEVLNGTAAGVSSLNSTSGVVLLACLFGRNLTHLHRPGPNDRDDDLHGEFWKRHRFIDSILSATALGLPPQLRLPAGLNNPNVIFLNMSIHTSTICLHQAAIFKADKNHMSSRVSDDSKMRCITAASQVATIMRTISHFDFSTLNPFISFCLYVASRVFVQYLKSRPQDLQIKASLQFLLHAMHAIKRKNPLTESFLVQLDVDLEGAGLENTAALRASMPKSGHESRATKFCPYENLDNSNIRAPAFGDHGVGVYNNPDLNSIPNIQPIQSNNGKSPSNIDLSRSTSYNNSRTNENNNAQRQRSPGSFQSSGNIQSPSTLDMDMSPDGNTPNSSLHHNLSSHTSNTGYSPNNQDQNGLHRTTNNNNTSATLFDPVTTDLSTDFGMNTLPPSQQLQHSSFVLPSDWGSTGLTPGVSSGFTPGPDMPSFSEADLSSFMNDSQMMSNNGFGNWDTGATMLNNADALEALLASRRS